MSQIMTSSGLKNIESYQIMTPNGLKDAVEVYLMTASGLVKAWVKEILYGEWSSWQDAKVEAIEGQRKVKTRTVYQYQTYGNYASTEEKIFKKCWSKATNNPNCENCGSKPSGGFGFWRGTWVDSNGQYNCHGSYKTYKDGWGHNGVLGATSGWVATLPDGAQVVKQKVQYAYADRIS